MSTLNRSPINISNNPSLLASPIAIAPVLKNLEKFNVDEISSTHFVSPDLKTLIPKKSVLF